MAIEFDCPYCTAAIRIGDQAAGKQGACPKCGTTLVVPRPESTTAASPSATSATDPDGVPDAGGNGQGAGAPDKDAPSELVNLFDHPRHRRRQEQLERLTSNWLDQVQV